MGGSTRAKHAALKICLDGDLVTVREDSTSGSALCLGLKCCAQVMGCRARFRSNQTVGTTAGRLEARLVKGPSLLRVGMGCGAR